MSNYLPDKDKDLEAWLENFEGVAGDNLIALGLVAADLTDLSANTAGLSSGLSNIIDLKAQLERAVAEKDGFRRSAESEVRGIVKRIQAKPGVPDGLKVQLGINVKSPVINRTPPVQPAALLATPQADGTNTLKWHKNGNKTTTQYVVLAKTLTNGVSVSSDADWTMVGLTTKAVFQHQGVTPGVPMAYKVMAARAGLSSQPSLPATVYAG